MRRYPWFGGIATAGAALLLLQAGCGRDAADDAAGRPAAGEAASFVDEANRLLLELGNRVARAQWVASNFITEDTQALAAEATAEYLGVTMELASEAARYDEVDVDEDVRRQLTLLKLATIPLAAPSDPQAQAALTRLTTGMEAAYGKGRWCPAGASGDDCLDINDLTRLMAESRDPDELRAAWVGWHEVGRGMRDDYGRFVELANAGARELGYPDLGALWRSDYDMPAEAFIDEVERLWADVEPLYRSLHTYVRRRLGETYGTDVVPADGPIPAHLLGNMWAQQWSHIYPLVAPRTGAPAYDLTELLRQRNLGPREMVEYGERFFTSLGFAPLPGTFWERSLFTQPRDRDVVCHASAWNVDNDEDLRIKMCIQVTGEDFVTIHHELGHNIYQRAYRTLPYIYRGSANDGFHEAIGDAVALSVTPAYLVEIGLLDEEPPAEGDLGYLLQMALDKVAFLPFGLLVDQWRWQVFSGEVTPDRYTQAWTALREQYQGVSPPVERTEADFDAGAKYHVPGNVPYTRYFLAHILQFQLHRAMCHLAGETGPLHRCSISGNETVGQRLNEMLEMGRSRPWPDALEALTGEREVDAAALLDYFAPLQAWLDEQNGAPTPTPSP